MVIKPTFEELKQKVEKMADEIIIQKQEIEVLRKTESQIKEAEKLGKFGYWEFDLDANKTNWSENYYRLLGYEPYEIEPTYDEYRRKVHPDDLHLIDEAMDRIVNEKKSISIGLRYVKVDGSIIWVENIVHPEFENNRLVKLFGANFDITDRKLVEIALRESEEKYRSILENIEDGYFEVDLSGNFTFFNDPMVHILGYSKEEMMGMNNQQYMDKANSKKVFQTFNNVFKSQRPSKGYGWEAIRKDGSKCYLETSISLIKDPMGQPIGFRGIARDISERKRQEEALKESEQKLRNIIEHSNELFYLHNTDHQLIYTSPQCIEIFGYTPEEMKIKWMELMTENPLNQAGFELTEKAIKTGEKQPLYTLEGLRKDGKKILLEIDESPVKNENGKVIQIAGAARDITERKELESQLQQALKMEAIGTLAGGIAHDFNNILAIILGNTELAIENIPDWNPARHNLEEARSGCLRARDVVRQLLAFSRKTETRKQAIRISDIINESLRLLRASIPSSIEIRADIDETSHPILGDPTQINQLLINLCTNARDAMEEEGGVLEIKLTNINSDRKNGNQNEEMTSGRLVKISVKDTGKGIPVKDLNRIFDPYFTTKDTGKGTGMGLAVVLGIVKAHDGNIKVHSELKKGTIFEIVFPATEKTLIIDHKIDAKILFGNERILFVDDEELVVEVNTEILKGLGYSVTSMTDPIQGLERFRSNPEQFDLIITDMTMPKMTGDQLVQELLQIRPDIPIILCTGYSEKISEEKAGQLGIKAYAYKPLEIRSLSQTIRKALDNR